MDDGFAVLVRINSEERVAPLVNTTSSFKVQFGNNNELGAINRVSIKQISIPNVQYNIKAASSVHPAYNAFTYNDGANKTITIPVGYYNIDQLIAAIKADPLAVAANLQITVNAASKRLQFTSTTPISYLNESSGNGMASILGILTNSAPLVTSYNATGFYNLAVHPNVYVASQAISDGSHMVSPTLGSLPVCAVVPITVPFGDIIQYTTVQEHLDDIHYTSHANGKSLSTIDLQIYDGDGQLLDLQGLDWTIVFKAYMAPP